MEATPKDIEIYTNQFFDWVGDAGCLFPPVEGTTDPEYLILVDIESMKAALDDLLYDKESKSYAVKVNELAAEKEYIYDPMEILPQPSEGLGVYKYRDAEDSVPELHYTTSLESFMEKFPLSIRLI